MLLPAPRGLMARSLKGTVCDALILVVGLTYKELASTRVISAALASLPILLDNVTLKCDSQKLFR